MQSNKDDSIQWRKLFRLIQLLNQFYPLKWGRIIRYSDVFQNVIADLNKSNITTVSVLKR
jgi:hypothetical protein